ncbi:MAG: RecQ family ATP-dependent DNA helicase [Acidobacteria bacterium]|nr:RecQ family ATP-dependent DNA helicase [Acidobacteriota bacterium]
MHFDRARALELLRLGTGLPDARFREGQEEAIRHVTEGRGRLLVVQRTGWGKSFVYFIATKLLREAGQGPTLLVSPLLALMRNQIAAAVRMGVRALTIHSENPEEWASVESAIRHDEADILLISPERLANPRFCGEVLSFVAGRIALLVVDETHCISDWGHDFRPHYRLLERTVKTLPPNTRLLATTATANNRVMEDLQTVLGPNLTINRGNLDRPSLRLQTLRLPSQAERLAWLAAQLPRLPGSGIVYTLTVRDAERVAAWLRSRGIEVAAYTSETGEARPELEQALLDNRVKALVATPALGMGFDKPDLAFVIHYQAPASVVTYYQQVGRAGRALDTAYGVLLSGEEETEITSWFIESAFPSREEVRCVLEALEAAPAGLSVPEMMTRVNLSMGRIEKALALISLESPTPIAKQGVRWQLTAGRLSEAFWERARRLNLKRREEQRQMQDYVALASGHMAFLIRALDGEPAADRPNDPAPFDEVIDPALVRDAVAFLRRMNLPIEARIQWPAGGIPKYGLRGRIDPKLRAQAGRALCVWGDAGWGRLVSRGKYHDRHYADELVEAASSLLREWAPEPFPEWVACVPSLRHPELVPDFARRLAAALGLPFGDALEKTGERPEQKSMANSIQQARNVDGSLGVRTGAVRGGPVLLVDDMVDSRWTFTIAAWLLRSHGSGEVRPFALAQTGHDR